MAHNTNFVLSRAAVRALTDIVRGKMSQTAPAPAPVTVSRDTFPAPFAVRWAQSENEGDGAWVIWLPDTAKLVMFAGAYVTPTGITAAVSLPGGYYTIDGLQAAATQIWLRIHPPASETDAATASFAGAADSGQDAINIQIAALATVAATGAKSVRQLVDSAIAVGGASGGGGEYTPTPAPFDFDADTGKIVRCVFYFDGGLQNLSDYADIPADGTVYLTITGTYVMDYNMWQWTFAIANAPAVASTNQRVLNVKLYDFANGAPSVDYRTTFLQTTPTPLVNAITNLSISGYWALINPPSGSWEDETESEEFVQNIRWIGQDDTDDPAHRFCLRFDTAIPYARLFPTGDGNLVSIINLQARNSPYYIECTPLSAALQSLASS